MIFTHTHMLKKKKKLGFKCHLSHLKSASFFVKMQLLRNTTDMKVGKSGNHDYMVGTFAHWAIQDTQTNNLQKLSGQRIPPLGKK